MNADGADRAALGQGEAMARRHLPPLFALMVVLAAGPASAEPSATSRLGWVTNGTVRAAAVHDQTLFIGGTFTRVAPAADFLGPWFGVSTTTGVVASRLPLADGPIFAIEPDGASGYFVGGRFTRIGGVARSALAHVLADGTVDPAFVPPLIPTFGVFLPFGEPTLDVRSLARAGNTLYVGGSFRILTASREGVAAVDTVTGAPRAWSPPTGSLIAEKILMDGGRVIVMGQSLHGIPTVMAAEPVTGAPVWTTMLGGGTVLDGVLASGRLIVAGTFSTSGVSSVASLDPATGSLDTTWSPHQQSGLGTLTPVYAVAAVGSTIYVGGRFRELGGQPRDNIAAIDLPTGTLTTWAPIVSGTVRDLAPSGGASLYVAGEFRRAGGLARDGLAEVDASGVITSWSPQAHSTDVRTLQVTGTTLLAGATSAVAGGVARDNLAAFALDANDVLPFAPALADEVLEIGTDGTRVFAGVNRLTSGPPPADPTVIAFDADSGAPSSWRAPDYTARLLGVVDGQVYVFTTVAYRWMLMRLDATSGAVDPSWRFDAQPTRLLFDRDRVYFLGGATLMLNGESRQHLAAVDRRTGALSPWDPQGLFPSFPEGSPMVNAGAVMGRTVFVQYQWSGYDISGVVAADRESGVPVRPTAPTGMRVLDLAAADGLLFGVGQPRTPTGVAAGASRPDGALADWNPGLTLTATDNPWNAQPRILASPTDIVVVGVQNMNGTPIHGVAVFARQPPAAPSSLEASVLDNAVRLTWTPPDPPATSYIVEAGSASGASNILVHDTGRSVPALEAVAPAGTYFVRVRSGGTTPGEASAPTNEIAVRVGCTAPIDVPPTRLSATVDGTTVMLSWEAPAFTPVARYVIEAGSAAGRANLARITLPGSETSFSTAAPPGTYFVRVRAESGCGSTPATPDVWLAVGGDGIPAAPTGLTIAGTASAYTAQWARVEGATAYLLEAGSRPGLADVARVVVNDTSLGPVGVAYGWTYYVRVRAVGPAGVGPPGEEYVLIAR